MKRRIPILTTIMATCLAIAAPPAVAQVPQLINYQGRLSDTSCAPLNATIPMTFRIFDAASGGAELWNEAQTVTCTQGIFNVLLGSMTSFPANLFASNSRYLQVESGAAILAPRARFVSVPYAFSSETAATAFTAVVANRSLRSDTSTYSSRADLATYSLGSDSARVADTALRSGVADTADFAWRAARADTALRSWLADTATTAAFADRARYAQGADTARLAETAVFALNIVAGGTPVFDRNVLILSRDNMPAGDVAPTLIDLTNSVPAGATAVYISMIMWTNLNVSQFPNDQFAIFVKRFGEASTGNLANVGEGGGPSERFIMGNFSSASAGNAECAYVWVPIGPERLLDWRTHSLESAGANIRFRLLGYR
ncbi:MAG: hypothetical protein AAB229_03285 [Candidatus Hydrogenedentota bacterium]